MFFYEIVIPLMASLAIASPIKQSIDSINVPNGNAFDSVGSNDGTLSSNSKAGIPASVISKAASPVVKATLPTTSSKLPSSTVSPLLGSPVPSPDALTIGWVQPGSTAFIDISVYHHNVHRANHSAPPVSWNNTLYQWAQKKASICSYNEDALPGWDDVGMNIAGGTYGWPKVRPNPSGMISGLWYNSELMYYPSYGVANPSFDNFEDWGHFTQVVWPSSTQIGCGLADCGKGWFGLCLYSPPGNWVGSFNQVKKPRGFPVTYPNGQTRM